MNRQEALQRRRLGRRRLLGLAGGTVAATVFGPWGLTGAASTRYAESLTYPHFNQAAGFGTLVPDPKGRLALPPGFQYRELSPEGGTLSNGDVVPSWHDGMAAFPGPNGTTILVRNHEVNFRPATMPAITGVPARNPYAKDVFGGTIAIVVGPNREELDSFVTSSGTTENCAGGATPWGTWLTCEEATSQGMKDEDDFTSTLPHGYVFEVDPADPESELSRTPIKEMGVFAHEAIGYDLDSGYIYLTEDGETELADDPRDDAGASFLYRFIPNDLSRRPGALQSGGTLQALKAVDLPPGNSADLYDPGQRFGVTWVDIDPDGPPADALAKECLRFNALEGAHFAGGAFWFCDTDGGEQRLGQIFRYIPATNTLELFYEGDDGAGRPVGEDTGVDFARLENPDNITIAPWGDVIVAEDGGGVNRLIGFTPEGESYVLALHAIPPSNLEEEELPDNFLSEVTGPTFSPDGQTLFFNVQEPGVTFAVWGPFGRMNTTRRRQMSLAAPPPLLAPYVCGELREAADRHRLSVLEAAAFHRLGVPIL
ncbi:MAG: alkaline phosphatase PhoX [Thermomicrobiales bacterium]